MMIGDKPEGGKWTYDDLNREKYPKGKIPPTITYPEKNKIYTEAFNYVNDNFNNNYGKINEEIIYPYNFKLAKEWLNAFLKTRFEELAL